MADNDTLYKCTRCHKKHFANAYRINRLGRRLKTCNDCVVSKTVYSEKHRERLALKCRLYRAAKKEETRRHYVSNGSEGTDTTSILTDAELDELLEGLV